MFGQMFGQHLRAQLPGFTPFSEEIDGGGPVSPPGLPPANPLGFAPPHVSSATQQAPAEVMPKMGRGQLIAGVLADALAGAMGRPGQFAQQLGQQRQMQQQSAQEQARWHRDRTAGLQDFEAQQRIRKQYETPDVAPMLRDAQAWAQMTPEQRTAYTQMKQAGAGDPDVFVTLPNGQVYAGPKSGLSVALQGGGQATAPVKPVGKLTIIPGGPTQPASGGFRP